MFSNEMVKYNSMKNQTLKTFKIQGAFDLQQIVNKAGKNNLCHKIHIYTKECIHGLRRKDSKKV